MEFLEISMYFHGISWKSMGLHGNPSKKKKHGMPCFPDRLDRYFAIGLETSYEILKTATNALPIESEYLAESSSDRALSCRFKKEGLISIGSLVSFRKINAPHNERALGVVSKIIMPKQKNKSLDFELQVIAEHIYNANQKNHDDATIVIVK